jgi:hypothetical protein
MFILGKPWKKKGFFQINLTVKGPVWFGGGKAKPTFQRGNFVEIEKLAFLTFTAT